MTRLRAKRVFLIARKKIQTVEKNIAIVNKKILNAQKASRKIFKNAQNEKNIDANDKSEAFID